MIVPYRVDVPMDRAPIVNWVMILAMVLIFISEFSMSESTLRFLALDGWRPLGLFTHMFLHGGLFHLIGNMIFLWTFGNAINAKFDNKWYFPLFVVFGLVAAATHNIFSDTMMIGASGAINGVVGCFLIFYPRNNVSVMVWFFIYRPFFFTLSSYWMILLWFIFDIWGALSGEGMVAYMAHLGGFFCGVGFGVFALKNKLIYMNKDEESLLQMLNMKEHTSGKQYSKAAQERMEEDKRFKPNKNLDWIGGKDEANTAVAVKPKTEKKKVVEKIKIVCDGCDAKITASQKHIGKTLPCPKCKTPLTVLGFV